jgi:hypothetical protein
MGLLPTLISVIQTYFKEMELYIDRYWADVNCIAFNERRWLEFRSLFLRVYRQPSVLLSSNNRESIVKVSYPTYKSLASQMSIGKPTGSCYLPVSEFDIHLAPSCWSRSDNNPFRRREIGVGIFNWWGATEMIETLQTAEKEHIILRPSTSHIYSNPSTPIKVPSTQNPPGSATLVTAPHKKRRNQRQRRSRKILESILQ